MQTFQILVNENYISKVNTDCLIDSITFQQPKNLNKAVLIIIDHLIFNSLFESIKNSNIDQEKAIGYSTIVQIIPKTEFLGFNLKIRTKNIIFTGKANF